MKAKREPIDVRPAIGTKLRDPRGVTWSVADHHGAEYVTLEAGALRRTLHVDRLDADGWRA